MTGGKQEVENRCTKATWQGEDPASQVQELGRDGDRLQERCLSRIACRMSEKSSVPGPARHVRNDALPGGVLRDRAEMGGIAGERCDDRPGAEAPFGRLVGGFAPDMGHEPVLRRGASQDAAEVEVPVRDVDEDDAGPVELGQIEPDGFAGQEVRRDHVEEKASSTMSALPPGSPASVIRASPRRTGSPSAGALVHPRGMAIGSVNPAPSIERECSASAAPVEA